MHTAMQCVCSLKFITEPKRPWEKDRERERNSTYDYGGGDQEGSSFSVR